jgi:RNA polymerase sigma-32 factor
MHLAPFGQPGKEATKGTSMKQKAPLSPFTVTSLAAYRQDIGRYPPLSVEDERELAKRYRAGDRRAGDKLIQACLPFVMMIAREYRCWGVPTEDLVQQGNLGLLKAAARFDPDRECRLITYAAYWVRAEIREHVVRSYRMVRLGTTKSERRALRAYRRTQETDPALLAEMSGLSREAADRLIPLLMARDTSADQPNAFGVTPLERIASADPTPEDRAISDEMRKKARTELEAFLREIPARERTILRSRVLRDDPVTLERLGRRFGISKERVRQLEERTLAQLKGRLLACSWLDEAC